MLLSEMLVTFFPFVTLVIKKLSGGVLKKYLNLQLLKKFSFFGAIWILLKTLTKSDNFGIRNSELCDSLNYEIERTFFTLPVRNKLYVMACERW